METYKPHNVVKCTVLGKSNKATIEKVNNFDPVCSIGYDEFKIGVPGNKYTEYMRGCFDPVMKNTLYIVFNLKYSINNSWKSYPRLNWLEGDQFYNLFSIR